MVFLYAILIGGVICAVTQLLVEVKLPFPIVAVLLMAVGGGVLSYTGTLDWLMSLGAGGVAVTALGCGNGAYAGGVALLQGNLAPTLMVAGVCIVLVFLGALAGGWLLKKHPECLPPEEAVKK